MTDANATSNVAEGRLVEELRWIHGIIRHDLGVIRELAERIRAGAEASEVRQEISLLKTTSPLWQLKVNCLYYCRLVHSHHNGEDAHLFPALRRANPALNPIVDKLEADHRKVSEYLDVVESASNDLVVLDTASSRHELVEALAALADHLIVHLDYEEENISPTLAQWTHWPFG